MNWFLQQLNKALCHGLRLLLKGRDISQKSAFLNEKQKKGK